MTDQATTPELGSMPAAETETALRQRVQDNPRDTEALVDLGRLRADAGDFRQARDLLDQAIGLDGNDARLHLVAAGMAANDGDFDAAAEHYRQARRLHSPLPEARVGLGKIAEMREQPSEAEAHFKAALEVDPRHVDAMLGMARLAAEAGDIEEAVQRFARAVQHNPDDARALTGYAQALMQRGTPKQAVRPLQRALEKEPSQHMARVLLGHAELYRGNIGAAEKAYRQVLQALPSNGDALAGLGDALRAQKRMDEALLAYDAARRQHPDAEMLTTLRATCLGAMDREQEAIEDLRAFVDGHPGCRSPRLLLADVYRNRGQWQAARDMWQTSTERDPEDALAWTELALAEESNDDYDAAARAAERSKGDTRPVAGLLRARVALRRGDGAAAEPELSALREQRLEPADKRNRLRLVGLAHDRAQRHGEAVLAFREAHRLDAEPLPPLAPVADFETQLEARLAEPELLHPRVAAPVLLLGLPGTGVDHIAALLRDQPGLAVRDDRFHHQPDFLGDIGDDGLLAPLAQGKLGIQARRYARAQDRLVAPSDASFVDWLPLFDARALPMAKLALPGVRAVIVDGPIETAFLRWLALGWNDRLRMADINVAAEWFNVASQQIELAAKHLPSLRIDGDQLFADPQAHGAELADFLGLEQITPGPLAAARSKPGRGFIEHFGRGSEDNYRAALGDVFAALG